MTQRPALGGAGLARVQPQLGVADAELNPVLVMPAGQGVLAVDALVARG